MFRVIEIACAPEGADERWVEHPYTVGHFATRREAEIEARTRIIEAAGPTGRVQLDAETRTLWASRPMESWSLGCRVAKEED